MRIAYRLGTKCTPAKVLAVPFFPMAAETTVRTGFLRDDQYEALLAALPVELKPLFVVAYETGIRKSELLAIRWEQVDLERSTITLAAQETKNGSGRVVPILDGHMRQLLTAAKAQRDAEYPACQWLFSRDGQRIRSIKRAWAVACASAGVPELLFHDLRRTAVRNMRNAGVPQVIRMRISGHVTDSMERRYSIVDDNDIAFAKSLMEQRKRS